MEGTRVKYSMEVLMRSYMHSATEITNACVNVIPYSAICNTLLSTKIALLI